MNEENIKISDMDKLLAKTKKNAITNKMIIGYCRVSTEKQSIDRQIRNIKEFCPEAVIVEEVYTGRVAEGRPKWDKIMKQVKRGCVNTIIFDSVSRLSRSKEEGSMLYRKLFDANVRLIFLKEPFINTDEYKKAIENRLELTIKIEDKATDALMRSIFNSLNEYFLCLAARQVELSFEQAEKEVQDLRQRTKEGLLSAKLNKGVVLGRRPGTKIETKKAVRCKKIIRKNFTAFGGPLNSADCIRLCNGIARSTFYRYLNQLLDSEKAE